MAGNGGNSLGCPATKRTELDTVCLGQAGQDALANRKANGQRATRAIKW